MPSPRTALAALRGIAGAFLAAFFTAVLWLRLAPHLQWMGSARLLFVFLLCPAACLGYWLARGLRRRKFAYLAADLCAFAGYLAAAAVLGLPIAVRCALGLFAGLVILLGTGQKRLLKYTDPAWYADPRRIAMARAGGAMYNYWPRSGFSPLPVPASFTVGGEKIHVTGGTVRVTPSLGRERTFSVSAAAGVLVGPPNGSCVLYDNGRQVLAKFGTSWKNANLFIQYLQSWGVPFYTYGDTMRDGLLPEPVPMADPSAPEASSGTETPAVSPEEAFSAPEEETSAPARTALPRSAPLRPRSFSVPLHLPHPAAAAGLIAAGFILGFAAFAAIPPFFFAKFPEKEDLMLALWAAVPMTLMLGPPIVLALTGQLLPQRLEVIGSRLYRSGIFLDRELTDRIAALRQEGTGGCWLLLDGRGKPLARFSGRDPEGAMLLDYLGEYHTALVRKWTQERK